MTKKPISKETVRKAVLKAVARFASKGELPVAASEATVRAIVTNYRRT